MKQIIFPGIREFENLKITYRENMSKVVILYGL